MVIQAAGETCQNTNNGTSNWFIVPPPEGPTPWVVGKGGIMLGYWYVSDTGDATDISSASGIVFGIDL